MNTAALIRAVRAATERAKDAYYTDTTCPEGACAERIDHTQARCDFHNRLRDAEKHRRKRARSRTARTCADCSTPVTGQNLRCEPCRLNHRRATKRASYARTKS